MRTVGCPSELSTARSAMPPTPRTASRISAAFFSSVARSSPYSLIEFSPFTPEAASSTLSWMVWEKLNSTPPELAHEGRVHLLGQLVLGHAGTPRSSRLERHVELGVEEAGGLGA